MQPPPLITTNDGIGRPRSCADFKRRCAPSTPSKPPSRSHQRQAAVGTCSPLPAVSCSRQDAEVHFVSSSELQGHDGGGFDAWGRDREPLAFAGQELPVAGYLLRRRVRIERFLRPLRERGPDFKTQGGIAVRAAQGRQEADSYSARRPRRRAQLRRRQQERVAGDAVIRFVPIVHSVPYGNVGVRNQRADAQAFRRIEYDRGRRTRRGGAGRCAAVR